MAFPTTPILDSFNAGGSQNLTARAGWSATVFLAGVTYVTNATPTFATCIGAGGGNQWGSTWPDMEAYCTIAAFNPATDVFEIAARVSNAGAVFTYYAVRMANTAATDFQIVKWNSGVKTNIGTLLSQTFTANDSVGISVIGSQITSYYKVGAGAWAQMDTVSDSSITGSGTIGFQHPLSVTNTVDDLGGGPPVVATPANRTAIPFTQGAGGGAFGGGGPH